jgi:hypothetical protein
MQPLRTSILLIALAMSGLAGCGTGEEGLEQGQSLATRGQALSGETRPPPNGRT